MSELRLRSPVQETLISSEKVDVVGSAGLPMAKLIARNSRPFAAQRCELFAGAGLPLKPGRAAFADGLCTACLAPGEWLFLGVTAAESCAAARASVRVASGGAVSPLVVDLTHGRYTLQISGRGASDLLKLLITAPFAPNGDDARVCFQTLFGSVGCTLLREENGNSYTVIVDISYAAYAKQMVSTLVL